MSNLSGIEIVMIMIVALIVLGPNKLPNAARQVGKAVTELRRISGGFQRELREAIQDPIIEADARSRGAATTKPKPTQAKGTEPKPDAAVEKESGEGVEPDETASVDNPSSDDG